MVGLTTLATERPGTRTRYRYGMPVTVDLTRICALAVIAADSNVFGKIYSGITVDSACKSRSGRYVGRVSGQPVVCVIERKSSVAYAENAEANDACDKDRRKSQRDFSFSGTQI